MNRGDFLKMLGLAPVSTQFVSRPFFSGIADSRPEPEPPPKAHDLSGVEAELARQLEARLGYRPDVTLTELRKTGDAEKWRITVVGREHTAVTNAFVSGLVLTISNNIDAERSYLWVKKAMEAGRDIAHVEGLEWRRVYREGIPG